MSQDQIIKILQINVSFMKKNCKSASKFVTVELLFYFPRLTRISNILSRKDSNDETKGI